MPTAMPAAEVLDREFLEIRAKILQIAASLDRFDRGEGSVEDDPRRAQISDGIAILRESESAPRTSCRAVQFFIEEAELDGIQIATGGVAEHSGSPQ